MASARRSPAALNLDHTRSCQTFAQVLSCREVPSNNNVARRHFHRRKSDIARRTHILKAMLEGATSTGQSHTRVRGAVAARRSVLSVGEMSSEAATGKTS